MLPIAVDAMGGDRAPAPEIAGAVAAVREAALEVVLIGDEQLLQAELRRLGADRDARLAVRHASEVVTMDDHPGQAFRQKRDSSLRVAFDMVKAGEASAVVSAGNSGAVLSHGLLVLRRLPGVDRPGIVTVFPTPSGTVVLCDVGANVDVRPTTLAQFGVLGASYDRVLHGRARPRVGLLSNGEEESKGTELTRAAHALLRDAAANPEALFDFAGYVEGSHIFDGGVDVVATDGFTGNVVLKTSEAVAGMIMKMIKRQLARSWRGMAGGLLAQGALRELKKTIDHSETGGALLIGVDGVVLICHGRSDDVSVKNAIKTAARFVRGELTAQLAAAIARHARVWEADGLPAAKTEGGQA